MKEMNKTILVAILAIGLFISGCSSHEPHPKWKHISLDENQLKDPSFESSAMFGTFHFWNSYSARPMHVGAHKGDDCLGYIASQGKVITKQLIDLKKRGFNLSDIDRGVYQVRFGGYQKGNNIPNEKGEISVSFFDEDKYIKSESLPYVNAGIQWKRFEKTVDIPKNTRYVQYNFSGFSTKEGSGPYLDDAFLYIQKKHTKTTVKEPIKKPTIKKSINTNDDISTVAYVIDNTVYYKNLINGKTIFTKEYSCQGKKGDNKPSLFIRNNLLHINSCWGIDKNIWFGDNEVVNLQGKKITPKKAASKSSKKSNVYIAGEKGIIKIYDKKTNKLLFSFKDHPRIYFQSLDDEKSQTIVFYQKTPYDFRSYKGNDFANNTVYVFDKKTKKGRKFSLAQKGKHYKSVFPVGFFIATNKKGEQIFFQISAQNKELDKIAKAAKNDFKDGWDMYGNLYPSVMQDKDTELYYKGINLSTMKYEKLKKDYLLSNLILNRLIQINDLFPKEQSAITSHNIIYKKLYFSNLQSITNTHYAITYIGDFNKGLSLIDLSKGDIVYASQRKIYPFKANIYREVLGGGRFNLVSVQVDTKHLKLIIKNLYSYKKEDRNQRHRFTQSLDGKLLLDMQYQKVKVNKNRLTKMSLIDLNNGHIKTIKVPKEMQSLTSAVTVNKFTDKKIFLSNDSDYAVVKL